MMCSDDEEENAIRSYYPPSSTKRQRFDTAFTNISENVSVPPMSGLYCGSFNTGLVSDRYNNNIGYADPSAAALLAEKDEEITKLREGLYRMKEEQEKILQDNKILKRAVFIQNNKNTAAQTEILNMRNLITTGAAELRRYQEENEILRSMVDSNHLLPFDKRNHDVF